MKTSKIVKIILAVGIVYILFRLIQAYRDQSTPVEAFEPWDPREVEYSTLPAKVAKGTGPGLTPQPGGVTPKPVPGWKGTPPSVSTDLLPKTEAPQEDFGEFAPSDPLAEKNFLEASRLIGADTIQSSLRNANYGLRKDPPIKKAEDGVGPWLNSTYTSDTMRKHLDC
jgi:hypothetical protein